MAEHLHLGVPILLKTLDKSSGVDPAVLERFRREARILARLNHEHIIRVLDFGETGPVLHISFEYYQGSNLRQALADGRLSERDKRDILVRIAGGLAFAHENCIIHRDIKPENILVGRAGEIKIADFGLALPSGEGRVTEAASVVGTPGYLSPEQIRGEPPSPQSDLFSLGILACELFSGSNPFMGEDVGATINNILTREIDLEKIGVPDDLRSVISALLARDPNARTRSSRALLRQLGVATPEVKRSGRRRRPLWIVLLFAPLIVAGLVVAYRALNRSESEPPKQLQKTGEPLPLAGPAPRRERPAEPAASGRNGRPGKVPGSAPGTLFIHALPWAEIYINSEKIDTTSIKDSLRLAPGTYEVRLQHPAFPPHEQRLEIRSNSTTLYTVDLDTLFGYLIPRVYPWGRIYVDEQYRGHTPLAGPIVLQPGEHRLRVINPGYRPVRRTVNTIRGDTLTIDLELEALNGDR